MEKWTCPYCGSTHVRVETTKVTAAGSIRKFMDCKECRRYYQIGEAAHKQYLAWKKSLNQ
jgi:transcriptional regulator NrdR family protein